ncbi:hypothetical protein [Streptomyces virginiae]|uniref:hypothetical protein n=1 Tax=Streptomyces virginiae TaxID=1961 RepID=UPI00324C9B57
MEAWLRTTYPDAQVDRDCVDADLCARPAAPADGSDNGNADYLSVDIRYEERDSAHVHVSGGTSNCRLPADHQGELPRRRKRHALRSTPVDGRARCRRSRTRDSVLFLHRQRARLPTPRLHRIADRLTSSVAGGGCVVTAVRADRQERFGGVARGAGDGPGRASTSSACVVPHGCACFGCSSWAARRRETYANDQGRPTSLVAVTARSSRSKVDQYPAEWLPLAPP